MLSRELEIQIRGSRERFNLEDVRPEVVFYRSKDRNKIKEPERALRDTYS